MGDNGAIPAVSLAGEPVVQVDPTGVVAPVVEPTVLPSEGEVELIGGKFKTQESLLEAYQALETKLGGGQESTPPAVTPSPAEGVPTDVIDEFTAKFNETGTITEDMYKDLALKGYSKDFVDTYVDGTKAQEAQAFKDLVTPIGGVDAYNNAVQWAVNNWSQEQIKQYNDALAGSESGAAQLIMKSVIDQASAAGVQPNGPVHSSGQPVATQANVYVTKSDYQKDANDPRYDADPGYRALVEAKMANTDMTTWYAAVPKGW